MAGVYAQYAAKIASEVQATTFEEVEKLSEGVALDMDGFELNVSLRKA